MAKIDLEVWLQGWQQGRREAFRDMHDWLAAKFLPFAERFLGPFVWDDKITDESKQDPSVEDDDKTTDESKQGPSTVTRLARDAFSALLEELSHRVEESDTKSLAVLAELFEVKTAANGEVVVVVRLFQGSAAKLLTVPTGHVEVKTAARGETVVVVRFYWDEVKKDRRAFERLCQQIPSRTCRQVLRERYRRLVHGEAVVNGETVEGKVFRGKVTGRLLAEREKFTWQGQQAFERLCREILIMQCRQVRREHYRRKHISLDPNPHEEDPRGSYNGQIIGSVSEGETGIVQREAVYELVEGLAQFSEQLRYKGKDAESETIEALLLYVKSKAAQTNPAYATYSVEALRSVPIERLLCHSVDRTPHPGGARGGVGTAGMCTCV